MLSILPLRAQNASNFRNKVSKKENGDKSESASMNDDTPRAVGLDVNKVDDKILVSVYQEVATLCFVCFNSSKRMRII